MLDMANRHLFLFLSLVLSYLNTPLSSVISPCISSWTLFLTSICFFLWGFLESFPPGKSPNSQGSLSFLGSLLVFLLWPQSWTLVNSETNHCGHCHQDTTGVFFFPVVLFYKVRLNFPYAEAEPLFKSYLQGLGKPLFIVKSFFIMISCMVPGNCSWLGQAIGQCSCSVSADLTLFKRSVFTQSSWWITVAGTLNWSSKGISAFIRPIKIIFIASSFIINILGESNRLERDLWNACYTRYGQKEFAFRPPKRLRNVSFWGYRQLGLKPIFFFFFCNWDLEPIS